MRRSLSTVIVFLIVGALAGGTAGTLAQPPTEPAVETPADTDDIPLLVARIADLDMTIASLNDAIADDFVTNDLALEDIKSLLQEGVMLTLDELQALDDRVDALDDRVDALQMATDEIDGKVTLLPGLASRWMSPRWENYKSSIGGPYEIDIYVLNPSDEPVEWTMTYHPRPNPYWDGKAWTTAEYIDAPSDCEPDQHGPVTQSPRSSWSVNPRWSRGCASGWVEIEATGPVLPTGTIRHSKEFVSDVDPEIFGHGVWTMDWYPVQR